MLYNILATILGKKPVERLVSVDIGSGSIKLMELEIGGERPKLISAAMGATPANSVQNNTVVKPELVGAAIKGLIEAQGITARKAVICLPGTTAFSKKISIGQTTLKELQNNIAFEAGNYIPHKIDAVSLDFQVLRTNGKSTMDVLLVAVKNEIVQSYVEAVSQSGLDPVIADIDYFALENMFELNYPEARERTVAVMNIGARFSTINILQDGSSIFTGDVTVGGKNFTDALAEAFQVDPQQAELLKIGAIAPPVDPALVDEIMEQTREQIVSELHRQLGFFWNAAATDRPIEAVYVCGGASQLPGLIELLRSKVGVTCEVLDSLRNVQLGEGFDADYVKEITPAMGVSVGLAHRRLGDKQQAIQ